MKRTAVCAYNVCANVWMFMHVEGVTQLYACIGV